MAIDINSEVIILRDRLRPLTDYIRKELFKDNQIKSQELVVNKDYNILALCDLSSDNTILEIKTNNWPSSKYKYQLFFESRGRECYHLQLYWNLDSSGSFSKFIYFRIFKVRFEVSDASPEGAGNKHKQIIGVLTQLMKSRNLELISYTKSTEPVRIKCVTCGKEFEVSYTRAHSQSLRCPYCRPNESASTRRSGSVSIVEQLRVRSERYKHKIKEKSGGSIEVTGYTGSKEPVFAMCKRCGYKWKTRADHLLDRCYCICCRSEEG